MEVPEAEAVDACLQPGEASIHHIKLVHGSGLNESDSRRIGIAFRYMAASVEQNLAKRDSVTLVSGARGWSWSDRICLLASKTSCSRALLLAHLMISLLRVALRGGGEGGIGYGNAATHIDIPIYYTSASTLRFLNTPEDHSW